MIRGMKWGRLCAVGVLGATLLVMPAAAERAADPDLPNLPARQNPVGSPVLSSYTSNLAFVEPSDQWIKMVDIKVSADTATMSSIRPAECERIFGTGSPRCANTQPGATTKNAIRALAYPVDFRGDDPASTPANPQDQRRKGARFSDFPAQRIRMLAFGGIPVEATMRLRLPTDSAGLPYGIQLDMDEYGYGSRRIIRSDTVGSGQVEVEVSDLQVDGVPVAVARSCRLENPALLTLRGRGYVSTQSTSVPPGYYNPARGGLLRGEIKVGKFVGCAVGEEDLSPLVTSMAGETEIPVQVTQAVVNVQCFTNLPAIAIEETRCDRPEEESFPAGRELEPLPPFSPPEDEVPPPVVD